MPDDQPERRNRLTVQGVVLSRTGDPAVQYRVEEDGQVIQWEQSVDDARAHAALVVEAAANATYEAALVEWVTTPKPDGPGLGKEEAYALLRDLRDHRRDKYGQPQLEDWREKPDGMHRVQKLRGK